MNNHAAILAQFNIKSLNDMQHAMLNAVQKPNDVVLVAPTGSGKTLGFLLPMLRRLKRDVEGVQLLIVVPSRELAIQIEQVRGRAALGQPTRDPMERQRSHCRRSRDVARSEPRRRAVCAATRRKRTAKI